MVKRESFIMVILLSVISVSALSYGQNLCIPVRAIPESERAFDGGEKLTYTMYYSWGIIRTDVAEASISITRQRENGEELFLGKLEGRTNRFFDNFFKVRYDFDSKFRVSDGRPTYFSRDIIEGRFTKKNKLYFQPDYSIKSSVQRRSDPWRDTLLQGRECTFDLISLIYFSRNINISGISPGTKFPISFVIDGEIYEIAYRYIGPERRKIKDIGEFKTLKFAAEVVAGDVFTGKEELYIWVTDDKNRIPIYFESPISVGRVTGRLSKYENIKHVLSSKMN